MIRITNCGSIGVRWGAMGCVLACVALSLAGCWRPEDRAARAAQAAYQKQLEACRELFLKDPLVPIVGGGHLDTKRFDFNVPSVRFEDGQCGTDGFETSFYWTGEKVLPAGERFTGFSISQIPPHWRRLEVHAVLGNRKFCKENPGKCKAATSGPPKEWPAELVLKLRHYDLEVRLPKEPETVTNHSLGLVMRGWPRRDGAPRFIICDIKRDLNKMSRDDIEDLDFGKATFPCQADFQDFDFKGGAARISLSTAILPTVTPALKALQQYISDSITREE